MPATITMHDSAGTTGHATPTSDATSWMSACHNAQPTPKILGYHDGKCRTSAAPLQLKQDGFVRELMLVHKQVLTQAAQHLWCKQV